MRKTRTSIALGCCLFALPVSVWAQNRKPGLWELTTTQTWQKAPAGMGGAAATRTTPVCLTQQQIDKYGAIVPHTPGCQVTNVVKTGGGMTGDWVCTGRMSGKGTLQNHMIDSDHVKGKVHFVGSLQAGANVMPIEWTTESSSVYKGPDCGDVKPVPDK